MIGSYTLVACAFLFFTPQMGHFTLYIFGSLIMLSSFPTKWEVHSHRTLNQRLLILGPSFLCALLFLGFGVAERMAGVLYVIIAYFVLGAPIMDFWVVRMRNKFFPAISKS